MSPESEIKAIRRENPSGWLELTKYESLPFIVEALIESRPGREFSKAELARKAGVSDNSVREHIETLVDLGVVEEVYDDRAYPRYVLDDHSPIARKITELNTVVSDVKAGNMPESLPERRLDPEDRRDMDMNTVDISDGGSLGGTPPIQRESVDTEEKSGARAA